MSRASARSARSGGRSRSVRLGFRLDQKTKELIEKAAELERSKVTAFCLTALTDAARRTIDEHERLQLSDRDRVVFFEALVNPAAPVERLKRAFSAERRRVEH